MYLDLAGTKIVLEFSEPDKHGIVSVSGRVFPKQQVFTETVSELPKLKHIHPTKQLIAGVIDRSKFGYNTVSGTHNGYVLVPKGHPIFGMYYNEIHSKYPDLEVHGGLTFSDAFDDGIVVELFQPLDITREELIQKLEEDDYWCVGFDTAHASDNPLDWNYERVVAEVRSLAEQLDNLR